MSLDKLNAALAQLSRARLFPRTTKAGPLPSQMDHLIRAEEAPPMAWGLGDDVIIVNAWDNSGFLYATLRTEGAAVASIHWPDNMTASEAVRAHCDRVMAAIEAEKGGSK